MAWLPFQLHINRNSTDVIGLLDTGATVNVLPFQIGLALGFEWLSVKSTIQLTGGLGSIESRPVVANALIGNFQEVQLAFARCKSPEVPLILGNVNFFDCFRFNLIRPENRFELSMF